MAGRRKVFYLSGNHFCIVTENKKEIWDDVIERIHDRCKEPFYSDSVAITLTAPMCVVDYPEDAVRLADIEALVELGLEAAGMRSDGEVVYANTELLEKHRRESRILQIMKRALKENQFAVFYQPIFSVEKQRFTSAEALIRLQNDELGFISPEEFIPLAEKNGLILITETAAVMSHETLMKNMSKLIEQGVNFSLDDYGTGFSNTTFVIKYPFRIVKIDKSMVWSAMEDEKAMYALKYTMAMMKAMGMELVAEGVENEDHIRLLTELGCDFFQGYYYSKPINGDLFLEKIGSL